MAAMPVPRTIQAGKCWWCADHADSREHKIKRSDLVREFGPPPYFDARTLERVTGQGSQPMHGPGSRLMKFDPSLCTRCNDTRSQPFDRAWDTFTEFLAGNEETVVANRSIDLRDVFGSGWSSEAAHVARYLVKHLACRIVQELPGPITLDTSLFDFLDGGGFPPCLQIDACLDLGVLAMLRVTRAVPSTDPQAANGGFLHIDRVWVELDERQHWHTPQGGLHYRYLALYWRIGGGGPLNPFAAPITPLRPSDQLFGPEFRDAMESQPGWPPQVYKIAANVPEGMTLAEALRAAGFLNEAERLEEHAAWGKGQPNATYGDGSSPHR